MKRTLSLATPLVALAAAAPAAAWAPQQLFSGGGQFSQSVSLSGNERGRAAAAFVSRGGIRLALARPGSPFARSVSVPGSQGGMDPRVDIDERGNVLVVWGYFDGTEFPGINDRDEGCCVGARMTVRAARSGHFRRFQNLTPKGRDAYVGAAAIVSGRVAVAWSNGFDRIRARFAPRGRRLGGTGSIANSDSPLAVRPSRTGATVTVEKGLSKNTSIREFKVGRGGGVSRLRTVLRGLPAYTDLDFATNSRGDQVASWSSFRAPLYVAVRRRGQRFRVRRLAKRVTAGASSVAISPDGGSAIAAWVTRKGGDLRVAARRRGGAFGKPRPFATPPGYASGVQTAVDDAGRALFEWEHTRGSGYPRVFAAFRSPRGRQLRRRRMLFGNTFMQSGAAAIDARGRGHVVWQDGAHVYAARASYP
jgi:hypothetical protein